MRPVAAGRAEAQFSDRIAATYYRLIELNGRKGAEPVDRWLHGLLPAAGRRAPDLGCGTGHHAMLLAERFEHVDAIDISGSMIDRARARRGRPDISYIQADLHEVVGTGRYDFILSAPHLPPCAGLARHAEPHQDAAGTGRAAGPSWTSTRQSPCCARHDE